MYTPPPQSRKALELLFSLHYFPLVVSGAITCAGLLLNVLSLRWTLCLAIPAAAVSLVTHAVEPILTFAPVGGAYGVRSLELCRDETTLAPPLTLFYPTRDPSIGPKPKVNFTTEDASQKASFLAAWLPFQDVRFIDGMARYAHLPRFLLRDMQFTRVRESCCDRREPLVDSTNKPRPIIVFSHGISGYPRLYSCLLMDLAARGAVVVAATHQDGSAAFCRDIAGDFSIDIDTALDWEVETREKQMMTRVKDIQTTLDRIQTGQLFRDAGYSEAEVQQYLDLSHGAPAVTLVGHSFGAATMMGVAMEEGMRTDVDGKGVPSRVRAVVAFDPWGQPLCGEYFHKAILAHRKTYTTPTLQFHSEAWVRWEISWNFFRDLATDLTEKQSFSPDTVAALEEAGRRVAAAGLSSTPSWYSLRTTSGTTHLSYCDLTQMSPVVYKKSYAKAPARAQIVEWANECLKFAAIHDSTSQSEDKAIAKTLEENDLLTAAILQRHKEDVLQK